MACLLDTLFPLRHRVDSSNRNEIPLSKSSPLFQTSPIFLHFVTLTSNIFISFLDQTFTTTQVKSNNINIAIWKKYLSNTLASTSIRTILLALHSFNYCSSSNSKNSKNFFHLFLLPPSFRNPTRQMKIRSVNKACKFSFHANNRRNEG